MRTQIGLAMLLCFAVVYSYGDVQVTRNSQASNAQPQNRLLFGFSDMITQSATPGELIHILEGESHGFDSLSVVITETTPNDGASRHRHACEEAHVVLAGKVEYTVGGETFVAEAPYVVRIPAGVWHSFKNMVDKTINVIGVSPKSRESEVDYNRDRIFDQCRSDDPQA
jgi:mannose-6-phosphate isomerase-like protein (cupin superfamily)